MRAFYHLCTDEKFSLDRIRLSIAFRLFKRILYEINHPEKLSILLKMSPDRLE